MFSVRTWTAVRPLVTPDLYCWLKCFRILFRKLKYRNKINNVPYVIWSQIVSIYHTEVFIFVTIQIHEKTEISFRVYQNMLLFSYNINWTLRCYVRVLDVSIKTLIYIYLVYKRYVYYNRMTNTIIIVNIEYNYSWNIVYSIVNIILK